MVQPTPMARETSKRIITIGKTNYDGDYEYKDNTTNRNIKRKNNYLDQFFLAMNREFLIEDDLLININSLKTKILEEEQVVLLSHLTLQQEQMNTIYILCPL